ncbi:hypothetical protein SNE40_008795 [Patella caerulea]|uniref:Uncharacterized protein n=2 Tax=Patella caerulea TaxID=87958 RepID=A0AAN8PP44_PATCE
MKITESVGEQGENNEEKPLFIDFSLVHDQRHQYIDTLIMASDVEMESMKSRPSSTPRIPTLSGRAKLVRTPGKTPEASTITEERETGVTEPVDPVLITEISGKSFLEDSENSDEEELYQHELGADDLEIEATSALEPVCVEPMTESRLDEYWDTDLEEEEEEEHVEEDRTVSHYKHVCHNLGVVPISYFIRHIHDREIKMRFHGLGPAATTAISLILKDDVHLERLNLQGNWMQTEGGVAIAKMLEENDYLTEVVLGDNKLGNEGGIHMCKMLDINAGLRILDLSGNDFDDNCAEHFATAIEESKYIKKLNLSRNRFGEAGGEWLGPAIGANDRLDTLDLSWNHLRKGGACAIAKGLKENVGLKVCRLAWNGFGPEGGVAMAEALVANQSLIELDLTGNRLNHFSAEKIAKSFKINDTLRILRMGNNLITTGGAIALVNAVNNYEACELQLLDLTDVPVEYEFLRIVEEIKSKKPDFRVIHGPVARSGNTKKDLHKRGINPYRKKEPVVILKEHIMVNDLRLIDILARYDPTGSFCITPEDFVTALDELAVPYDKPRLREAIQKISTDQSGRILLGDALQNKDLEQLKRVVTFTENEPET